MVYFQAVGIKSADQIFLRCLSGAMDGMRLKSDVENISDRRENRRQVFHRRVATGREHAVYALARAIGRQRDLFKAYCRIDYIAQQQTRSLRLAIEEHIGRFS